MEFSGTIPPLGKPLGDGFLERLPALPKGMLVEQILVEQEPNLLDWIGRGGHRSAKARTECGSSAWLSAPAHTDGNAPANCPARGKSHRRLGTAARRSRRSG